MKLKKEKTNAKINPRKYIPPKKIKKNICNLSKIRSRGLL